MMPCCYGNGRSHDGGRGSKRLKRAKAKAAADVPGKTAAAAAPATSPTTPAAPPPPQVLAGVLGKGLAQDVHRTYALDSAGYDVEWSAIPACVTQKNRILIARRRPKQTAQS